MNCSRIKENFITSIRACSYGKKLSQLARKYFDSRNNFVLFIWEKLSRLPGKVSSCDVYTVHICLHRSLNL